MQTYSFFSRVPNFFSYFFMKPLILPEAVINHMITRAHVKIFFVNICHLPPNHAYISLFQFFPWVADSKSHWLSATVFALSYTERSYFNLFFEKKAPENVAIFTIFL